VTIKVKTNLDLRGFLLGNYFPGDSLSLSERLYSPAMVNAIAEDLRVAMSGQLKFRDLVKDLSNYTTAEDLKKPIREIVSAARQVMRGDMSDAADLKKLLNAYPDLTEDPSALDKAYNKIVTAADNLSSDMLDKAVDNALDKKALSNAFRLAVTETNRAYNIGAFTEAVNDEDCVAGQFDVSTSVENCEICLELSERDNGAGPGIYSLDNFPAIPIHPHCFCVFTPVYKLPGDMSGDDLETGSDYDVMTAMDEGE
jgi:hypothetical protein